MAHADAVEIEVPPTVARLDLFDRVDYEDAFLVKPASGRSPEQVMRDVLEGAPTWFLQAWSNVLGRAVLGEALDLRPSPDRIAGWTIVTNASDLIAIAFDTPRGLDARLFAVTSIDKEIVGTQIRLNTTYARRWWPVIRAGHRFILPRLVRRSARRAAANGPPSPAAEPRSTPAE